MYFLCTPLLSHILNFAVIQVYIIFFSTEHHIINIFHEVSHFNLPFIYQQSLVTGQAIKLQRSAMASSGQLGITGHVSPHLEALSSERTPPPESFSGTMPLTEAVEARSHWWASSEARGAARFPFIWFFLPIPKLRNMLAPVLEHSLKHQAEPKHFILRTKNVCLHAVLV